MRLCLRVVSVIPAPARDAFFQGDALQNVKQVVQPHPDVLLAPATSGSSRQARHKPKL